MKFAQHSGENSDWYLSDLTDADFETMTTAFFPKTTHQLDNIGPIKFWPSVCSFYGECNQTKIHEYNREAAKKKGAEFLFGTEALYVIKENDAVAGLVAKNGEGNLKISAKAVVIACGGFGGNPDMMADLMPDMYNALVGEEQLTSMSANNGRGVQMAYWAGAHLETCPIPGMNMKGLSLPGKMNCLPQSVWIDENGKRFCNEYYATSEQRGLETVYRSRKTKFAVLDSNFPEYRQYTIPQHAGFTATEENIASLQESLDKAYAIFKGTYEEPAAAADEKAGMGPVTTIEFIADDTLEGLAGQLGFTGDAAKQFVTTITNYNAYCEAGADQEYGRDAAVLFPVNKAPYYACTFDPVLGETMVTCGGIITDGEQNALDENFEPIPGLYVSGNDCGRRFGYEYITPIPGCSLGMAITLGRECGKSVSTFLG
ncbi:MAG: FAD-binding protein, partial [Raoultibacter sp.]